MVKKIKIDLCGRFLTLKLDHGLSFKVKFYEFGLKMGKKAIWGHFGHFESFRLRRKDISFPRKGNFSKFRKIFLGKSRETGIPEKFSISRIFLLGLVGLEFIPGSLESRGSGISKFHDFS